jgi:hypothetical protein
LADMASRRAVASAGLITLGRAGMLLWTLIDGQPRDRFDEQAPVCTVRRYASFCTVRCVDDGSAFGRAKK